MKNELYNNQPEFTTHPLRNLLIDCMRADQGGACTGRLRQAIRIEGWHHQFLSWHNHTSIEKITWTNDEVYNSLVNLYK